MWVEPEDAVPTYMTYNLSCSPLLMGVASHSISTSPGATWAELGGLEAGTTYACSIRAEVAGYMSEIQASVQITTDTTRKCRLKQKCLPYSRDINSYGIGRISKI